MNKTIQKIINLQFESELSKLVIDLVWSATDGGCKLKESDFSHFEEPLHEWTALVNKFSTSIAQAEQEMLKRVLGLYGTPNCDNLHHSKKQQHTGSEICPVVREIEDLLSSLDKEIINPKK